MNGLACAAIPDQRCFALIGNANRGDLMQANTTGGDRLSQRGEYGLPKILWVMLDPSRLRIMLGKFFLRARHDRQVSPEGHRP